MTHCDCACDTTLPIETVHLSEFVPEVEAEAWGVPSNVAQLHILEAAIEFTREVPCVTRSQVIKPQACVSDYFLTPRKGEQISRVLSICVDETKHNVNVLNDRVAFHCFWGSSEWRFKPPFQLHCDPAPKYDGRDCIAVEFSVMPTRDACEVDRELYDRFRSQIVNGALARVLKMTRGAKDPYPWTDKTEADRRRNEFRADKAEARTKIAVGFGTGSVSVHSREQREAGF